MILSVARKGQSEVAQGVARVMICDDSLVIRTALTRMLESDARVKVVARASNGIEAVERVQREPGTIDVVVLDIEMPGMDGMAALPLLLSADPKLRIIMASTLTTRGADIAMRALRLGAADYVPKPATSAIADDSFRSELLAKVTGLARLRRAPDAATQAAAAGTEGRPIVLRPAGRVAPMLLAIGSSTGGPHALFTLIQALGRDIPIPVVLTQHMPPTFTGILAEHLTRLGGMPCAEPTFEEVGLV
jgi:two-component system chemotaxis response regulator CheB